MTNFAVNIILAIGIALVVGSFYGIAIGLKVYFAGLGVGLIILAIRKGIEKRR